MDVTKFDNVRSTRHMLASGFLKLLLSVKFVCVCVCTHMGACVCACVHECMHVCLPPRLLVASHVNKTIITG